ncbi:STAS domain-containing protein [Pseudalkalibacillus caeni]|uniref:STAS domain-containing protein n=1 Tax=Exobacillus caeni TaxID=2574798 RepID=A0A5R9F3G5_9BACL|nr:STAS domain-containing protein [Pseudalkalibacillus caeni]TLS36876.1 STAS domain-containing protein [Pseudalkalibacillus caeni]
MHRNRELYAFLLDKAKRLTEEWYESLDKSDPEGVYASSDPEIIERLKEHNYEFHLHACKIFIEEKATFVKEFDEWILNLAADKEHLETPTHFIIREFINVREQYLSFLKEFVSENKVSRQKEEIYNQSIIDVFDIAILRFTEEKANYLNSQLESQKAVINELSSPVISLNNKTGLLPLVGEIDTYRAKTVLEKTLQQSSAKGLDHLFIDLSGVIMVDTMVAHQLFQLIDTLKLLGITTTLSGIRPEIAQTAVQLGLNFENISTTATLSQAIILKTN